MVKDDFPPGYMKPTMTQGSSGSPGQTSNDNINARQNQHAQMLKMTRGGSGGAGKILAPEVPTPAGNGPGGPGQNPSHNNNNATSHAMQGHANREYDTITGGSKKKKREKRKTKKSTKKRSKKKRTKTTKKRRISKRSTRNLKIKK